MFAPAALLPATARDPSQGLLGCQGLVLSVAMAPALDEAGEVGSGGVGVGREGSRGR